MGYFNPWVDHNGFLTWAPEVRLHTKCPIGVVDFPFDRQCCEVRLYSWGHTIKQLKLAQYEDKNTTNITHLTENSGWRVYRTCATSEIYTVSSDLHRWINTYMICVKRNSTYHVYNLILPCFSNTKPNLYFTIFYLLVLYIS